MSNYLSEEDDARLAEIRSRANAATPAPWHVNYLDDDHSMNLVAVTTIPDNGSHAIVTEEIRDSFVATTLLQASIAGGKPFVQVDVDEWDGVNPSKGGRWDEDAKFIAHAREDIPFLLDLIQKLEEHICRTQ